uniref:NADH dehydrogenase subunit 7 n=1 Tax=Bakuella subtropica TaxID=1295181 RepID=UPI0023EFDFDD|nr:NADH dehydrogenase subunit 7 [Bakuella subtropica]WDY80877.1 NADH dehydrogenase subunit 7 [Bakuella subtropica]
MKAPLFNFWSPLSHLSSFQQRRIKSFILNFGPQHPASHGVLRLVVQLNGELVERADPHVGFLHRGTEKLMESRNYIKSLPYLDRLDYVSMMTQEHAYCLAIENLLQTSSFSSPYVKIRVLFDELTRILNHLLAISTHSLDVGNMSPVFWAFEERERIMEFYERVSGARMHAAFYRPNDIDWTGLNTQFFLDVALFARDCFKSLTEIFAVLVTNKIWKSRLVNIGSLTFNEALSYGVTGPIVRSVGIRKDLRFSQNTTYSNYWFLSLKGFLGKRGDSYDRFLIRMREMFESVNLIFQILSSFSKFNPSLLSQPPFLNFVNSITPGTLKKLEKQNLYLSMEYLITHFKNSSEGLKLPRGFSYAAVEAPKGEFGINLLSDGTESPFRLKIRTPAYHHIQVMPKMVTGHFFADLVTVLGSQDIVFGDVDR